MPRQYSLRCANILAQWVHRVKNGRVRTIGFHAIQTSRTLTPEVNELEEAGLETLTSKRVKPPRIKAAVVMNAQPSFDFGHGLSAFDTNTMRKGAPSPGR